MVFSYSFHCFADVSSNPSDPPSDGSGPIGEASKDSLRVINSFLHWNEMAGLGATCKDLHKSGKDAIQLEVAKKVKALFQEREAAGRKSDWNEYGRKKDELINFALSLANARSSLLAVVFYHSRESDHEMGSWQRKMVRHSFNSRDFEKLQYLLFMGADPRISHSPEDRARYNGITDRHVNILSWAIENHQNNLVEASLQGLKAKDVWGSGRSIRYELEWNRVQD